MWFGRKGGGGGFRHLLGIPLLFGVVEMWRREVRGGGIFSAQYDGWRIR